MKRHVTKKLAGVYVAGTILAVLLINFIPHPRVSSDHLIVFHASQPSPTEKQPTETPTSIPTATPSALQTLPTTGQCVATLANPQDASSALPDPSCTPGSLNAAVTQDTIGSTICTPGYTSLIRPPESYTESLKIQQMALYAFTDSVNQHEEDHLIPLELGGGAKNPLNLWPEPGSSPNKKDKVENYLLNQVCQGQISLLEAQQEISTNWYKVLTATGL